MMRINNKMLSKCWPSLLDFVAELEFKKKGRGRPAGSLGKRKKMEVPKNDKP